MNKTISLLALAAAVLGLGSSALAADSMMAPDTMAKSEMTHVATMLCRPAESGEKSNAMTANNSALVCKPVDMTRMMSIKQSLQSMPDGQPLWLKMFQEYHIGANGV